jgi:hypothetical protein
MTSGKYLIFLFIGYINWGISQTPQFGWARSIDCSQHSEGHSVQADANGNVFTVGTFKGTIDLDPGPVVDSLNSAGDYDIFIQKHDATGNILWTKRVGGASEDRCESLCVDAVGNIYIAGSFYLFMDSDPGAGVDSLKSVGGFDSFICKLDNNGNLIWRKQFCGKSNSDHVNAMCVDGNGNIFTTGSFVDTTDFDPGPDVFNLTEGYVFVSKLDVSGNFVWAKKITGQITPAAISLNSAGEIVVGGIFSSSADFDPSPATFILSSNGNSDAFIVKLNAAGNLMWAKKVGGAGYDECHDLVVDAYDNIWFCGFIGTPVDFDPGPSTYTLGASSFASAFFCRWTYDGTFGCAGKMDAGNGSEAHSITTDIHGDLYVTGSFNNVGDFDPGPGTFTLQSAGFSDVFTAKYTHSGALSWAYRIGTTSSEDSHNISIDNNGSLYTTGLFANSVDFDPFTHTYTITQNAAFEVFTLKLIQQIDAVEEHSMTEKHFSFFPNPAGHTIYVNCPLNYPVLSVKIYNSIGEKVIEMINMNTNTIDVSFLKNGIYFLYCSDNERLEQYKFIKN